MKRTMMTLASLAVLTAGACSTSNETTPEQYEELAESVCQDAVRDVLKDPGSAEFEDIATSLVVDGEEWKVTGQVNANNSFGGKVGYQGWSCTATYTEDDDTMRGSARLENG